MKRLLLISPAFHGYWRSIATAWRRRGYQVHTYVYDAHPTLTSKVAYQMREELPRRAGFKTAETSKRIVDREAARRIRVVKPHAIVVVKGDTLGQCFWEAAGDRPVILWLYDELRRTKHTLQSVKPFSHIASYSKIDVARLRRVGVPSSHLPLAFDQNIAFHPRSSPEIVFVGARYDNRERLLTWLHDASIPVRAYGRDWSRHVRDRVRTWSLRRPPIPSGHDLPRPQAYGVMSGAFGCLNIHGDQDGFTMRTFEAGGVGALHLIDRADVSDYYDPGTEVAVFQTPEECAELSLRCFVDPQWADQLRDSARARTLAEHTFDHRVRTLEKLWA